MKQVNDTECGPIIICDECFDSMNRYSIEIGAGAIVAVDISGKIPNTQGCDLCGSNPMRIS